MTDQPALSVIIPFYNEAGNVLPVVREVVTVLGETGIEIICVNDASTDATGAELSEAAALWPDMLVIQTHRQRKGKSAAIKTGLRRVRAEWVQLLDGDGQNNPADTLRVWERLAANPAPPHLGLIAGRRLKRHDGALKWMQSRVANAIRRSFLKDNVRDTGCGWKLARVSALREVPYFAAMHRFLPALVVRAGWEVIEEPVDDRARWAGVSKYGFFGRAVAGLFDLLGVIWLVQRGQHGEVVERTMVGEGALLPSASPEIE